MDKLLPMLNCLPLINQLDLACHNKRKQVVYENTEEKKRIFVLIQFLFQFFLILNVPFFSF